jgi:hypothetical protein
MRDCLVVSPGLNDYINQREKEDRAKSKRYPVKRITPTQETQRPTK